LNGQLSQNFNIRENLNQLVKQRIQDEKLKVETGEKGVNKFKKLKTI